MAESDSASRHGQFRALMGGVGAGQRGAQRPPLLALHRSPASQTKDALPHKPKMPCLTNQRCPASQTKDALPHKPKMAFPMLARVGEGGFFGLLGRSQSYPPAAPNTRIDFQFDKASGLEPAA